MTSTPTPTVQDTTTDIGSGTATPRVITPRSIWQALIGVRYTAVGVVAGFFIALGSFGGGAIRYSGGIMDALDLNFFTYGHGAGLCNALLFTGLFGLAAAWVGLGRDVLQHRVTSTAVLHTLVLWAAPFIFCAPILSRDVYSYLMQGAMLRDGFDPYSQGASVDPGPYLLEVSHDWRTTTTPYGPLHLGVGKVITTIVGDNVTVGVIAWKLLAFIGFGLIAWATPRIATALGGDPALALWIGVANPVVVLHLLGGLHNEALMVGLAAVGLVWALQRRFIAAVAIITVAVALKATAVFFLPFVVWIACRRPWWKWLLTSFGFVVEFFVVLAAITYVCGTNWGWVREISGNSKVINPLAMPSLLAGAVTPFARLVDPDFSYNAFLAGARIVCSLIMLAGVVWSWWYFRRSDRDNVAGITSAYGFAVVFNAVTLPWYYVSPLQLLGTFTPPRWLIRVVAIASIIVALSFTGSGNHKLYDPVWLAIVGVFAVLSLRWAERSNTAEPSSTTPATN